MDAATGEATIPFVASPGNSQPAVLIAGDGFAALTRLDHHAESYSLAAGAHVSSMIVSVCLRGRCMTPLRHHCAERCCSESNAILELATSISSLPCLRMASLSF